MTSTASSPGRPFDVQEVPICIEGKAAIEIALEGQVRIAAACKSSFRPIPLMVVSKEGPVARGVPYQCSYMI